MGGPEPASGEFIAEGRYTTIPPGHGGTGPLLAALAGFVASFLALVTGLWWTLTLTFPVAIWGTVVFRRRLEDARQLPDFQITTKGVVVNGEFRPYASLSMARLSNLVLSPLVFAGFDWYLELEWPDLTSVSVSRGSVHRHEQVINAVLRSLPQPLLEGMNQRRVRVAFPRTTGS